MFQIRFSDDGCNSISYVGPNVPESSGEGVYIASAGRIELYAAGVVDVVAPSLAMNGYPCLNGRGAFLPPASSDSGENAMDDNAVFFHTGREKLVYKDASGTVHDLY